VSLLRKTIDQQTAAKYQAALHKAGAVCEVKNCSVTESVPIATAQAAAPAATDVARSESGNIQVTAPDIAIEAPTAPETAPLHITASEIESLSLTVAPVGSDMQDEINSVPAPAVDISGLDMAPVGSDISDKKEHSVQPLPDTTGLKMLD